MPHATVIFVESVKKLVETNDKAIECEKCNNWIHIKCNNISTKQCKQYQDNSEDTFQCKNCNKCGMYDKMVAKNHHAIECNICCRWIHLKCNKLSEKEYNFFQENKNMPFFCIKCMADYVPFLTLDDKQFELTAKGIDYTEEIDLSSIFISQPQLEMLDRFNAAINNITFDLNEENNIIENENIIPPANCKYYTIDKFHTQKFNSDKHFSILHLNISSIEYHIEEF